MHDVGERISNVPFDLARKHTRQQRCYQDQGVRDQDQTKTRQAETKTKTKTRETETKTREAETKTKTSRVETKTSKSGLDRSRDQDQVSRYVRNVVV